MKSKILFSSGKEEEVVPKNGKDFKLEELNKIVVGLIEVIRLPEDMILVINEEGKLKDLPYNSEATKLCSSLFVGDYIVGDVLYCKSNMVK